MKHKKRENRSNKRRRNLISPTLVKMICVCLSKFVRNDLCCFTQRIFGDMYICSFTCCSIKQFRKRLLGWKLTTSRAINCSNAVFNAFFVHFCINFRFISGLQFISNSHTLKYHREISCTPSYALNHTPSITQSRVSFNSIDAPIHPIKHNRYGAVSLPSIH